MRESLSPSCSPLGSTDGLEWFSSTRSDPPSPTGIGKSSRSCSTRSSSRIRSDWRAKYPISGSLRFASSSVMTTTGRTTACSANRNSARGSDRSTEVSSTYVRSDCATPVGVVASGRCLRPEDRPKDLEVSSEATTAPAPSVPLGSRAGRRILPRAVHEPTRSGNLPDASDATTAASNPRQRHANRHLPFTFERMPRRRRSCRSRVPEPRHRVSTTRRCRTTRRRRAASRGSRRWWPRAR